MKMTDVIPTPSEKGRQRQLVTHRDQWRIYPTDSEEEEFTIGESICPEKSGKRATN